MRNRLKEFPIGCKSEDGRLHDPVSIGILSAVTLGTSLFSSQQQKKASEKASSAQQEADFRARKIAAEQKPMEETATLGINTGANTSALGSLGLLIEPDKTKKSRNLGTSGSTGLSGTGGTAGLGFGG